MIGRGAKQKEEERNLLGETVINLTELLSLYCIAHKLYAHTQTSVLAHKHTFPLFTGNKYFKLVLNKKESLAFTVMPSVFAPKHTICDMDL